MKIFYFLTILAFVNSQTTTDGPVAMSTTESPRTVAATTDPGADATTPATTPVTVIVTADQATVTVTVGPISTTEIQQQQTTAAPDVLIASTTTTTDPTVDPMKDQNELLNYVKSIGFRNAFIHEDHIDADRSVHGTGTTIVKPIAMTSSTVSTTTRPQHGVHVSSDVGRNQMPRFAAVIMVITYYIGM